jgi:threonine/homoserine/homoserine lactone efflux protein
MTDPLLFALAALGLLLTPGPTNTLLATSGATVGARASLRLILAELAGYASAIALVTLTLRPLLGTDADPTSYLKAALACYLVFVAIRLWRNGAITSDGRAPIGPREVFITTLLNPKAIVFVLVIVPHLRAGELSAATPYLAGLAGMIVGVACVWITLGAWLRRGSRHVLRPLVIRRAGSLVLFGFAALMLVV